MDETEFKSHAEKEFWEKVYIERSMFGAALATEAADAAVALRRARMGGLSKPGVKAA